MAAVYFIYPHQNILHGRTQPCQHSRWHMLEVFSSIRGIFKIEEMQDSYHFLEDCYLILAAHSRQTVLGCWDFEFLE